MCGFTTRSGGDLKANRSGDDVWRLVANVGTYPRSTIHSFSRFTVTRSYLDMQRDIAGTFTSVAIAPSANGGCCAWHFIT